jgi:ComF family protein
MNLLSNLFFLAKGFLFPSFCALCGESLDGAEELKYGLCGKCRASLAVQEGDKCALCGRPLVSETGLCLPCRNGTGRSYDRLWVLYPYTGKYRELLAEYKFKKNLSLACFFARKILDILDDPLLKDAVLVPVPPRPGKIKENGWDQVDCLVKELEKHLKKNTVSRCLKRGKSMVQKRLRRADRLENMKGRIEARCQPPKTVLIIDDVVTTGSTMEVCAAVLKENGAAKVYGLCLFYD